MIYTSNPSSISLECKKGRSPVQVALCREKEEEKKTVKEEIQREGARERESPRESK